MITSEELLLPDESQRLGVASKQKSGSRVGVPRSSSTWAGIFLGWTHPHGGEDASLLPATRRPLRFDFWRARLLRRVGGFLRG
jgi:hypothetical protein